MSANEVKRKTIYILLTYTGSLLSKMIKMYTGNHYTHVSLGLDINLNDLYSFGRLIPNNPIIAGFVKEDIKYGTYAYFKDTTCCLFSLSVSEIEYDRLKECIHKFELEKDKYSYNLIGFLGIIFNKPIPRKHSFFCSQFVAYILNQSGIELFDKPPALVTPYDFQVNPHLNKIYEGPLMEYNPVLMPFNHAESI